MSRFKRKKARGPARPGKNRRSLFRQRPPCPLVAAGRTDVDYKDLELLARYTYAEGRIVPARITNISAKMQRKLTRAIKIARQLALMPYTEVQQREQRAVHPELRGGATAPTPPRGRARMPGSGSGGPGGPGGGRAGAPPAREPREPRESRAPVREARDAPKPKAEAEKGAEQ